MNSLSRRRLFEAGTTWIALTVLLAGTAGIGGTILSTASQRVVVNFLIVTALVVAIQSFVGTSGLLSFGHVAFFGTGAYAAALVTIPIERKQMLLGDLPAFIAGVEWGLWGAVLVAVVVACLVAAFTGAAIARMEDMGLIMATLALLVMMHTAFANWETLTRGTIGILGIPDLVGMPIALISSVLVIGAALLFAASPPGLRLQAVRENKVAAAALGISVARSRFIGWMVSAGLIGFGSAIWALNNLAFGPDQFFFSATFTLLSMLVIGGMTSVSGAVAGAAVVTAITELLRPLEGGFAVGPIRVDELPGLIQLAVAVLIIVILVVAPRGLTGGREFGSLWRQK